MLYQGSNLVAEQATKNGVAILKNGVAILRNGVAIFENGEAIFQHPDEATEKKQFNWLIINTEYNKKFFSLILKNNFIILQTNLNIL